MSQFLPVPISVVGVPLKVSQKLAPHSKTLYEKSYTEDWETTKRRDRFETRKSILPEEQAKNFTREYHELFFIRIVFERYGTIHSTKNNNLPEKCNSTKIGSIRRAPVLFFLRNSNNRHFFLHQPKRVTITIEHFFF